MKTGVSFFAVGHATSLFLAITFALCVGFDLMFPEHAMYRAWQDLLPGFVWLSWKSFLIGFIEAWAYGWYFALFWVPIYNFVAIKDKKKSSNTDSMWGSSNRKLQ